MSADVNEEGLAVARAVLSLLDRGLLVAARGGYLWVPPEGAGLSYGDITGVADRAGVEALLPHCRVCALGAAFVALALRRPGDEAAAVWNAGYPELFIDYCRPLLEKVWSREELRRLEDDFEMCGGGARGRLRAVMENCVAQGGHYRRSLHNA